MRADIAEIAQRGLDIAALAFQFGDRRLHLLQREPRLRDLVGSASYRFRYSAVSSRLKPSRLPPQQLLGAASLNPPYDNGNGRVLVA
jgi:hypothetical protein